MKMSLFGKQQPEQVQILDAMLQCEVCKNNLFWKREAQLNTAAASFFNFDWVNPSAVCYVCTRCGYIHWFFPKK